MYYISCAKIVFLILIWTVVGLQDGDAQIYSGQNYNYKGFQRKPYYFGLSVGVNRGGYNLNQSKVFIGNDEFRIVEPEFGSGLELHMIGNLKLGDNFDFRFLPGFSFQTRRLLYTETETDNVVINDAEPVFFELPFQLRYKSQPYKDKRVFAILGLKYGYDVAGNSEAKQSIIRFSSHDFQWEAGLGMQFFYPYFIFSPEIKFSRGMTNNLIYDNALEPARVLENVFSQAISISFNFEG